MTKDYARDFWQRYLRLVCGGDASMSVENPASDFTVRARAGEYDHLSDEEYGKLLAGVEQIQPLWDGQPRRAAGDILLDALSRTKIYGSRMANIVELLAESSIYSDYRPAGRESDLDKIHAAQRERALDGDAFDCDWTGEFWTPREIYDLLERVHGQERAKKAAAMIVYNHVEGRRSNTIFCGPSGCGKSEIWRCMAKTFSFIRMIDASRLTADGWRGSVHVRDIFEGASPEDLQDGIIVVLDEADKICCETAVGSGGTNYNALTQNSLLKLLDGDVVEFGKEDGKKAFSVDCSKVSFVLLGAFETLLRGKSGKRGGGIGFGAAPCVECDYTNTEITYGDLIDAGMRREIAGRINRIVPLRPLGAADYRAILTGSVLKDMQAAIKGEIAIDDASVDYLAEQAASTGLGVRWMRSQVQNALDDLMFDDPSCGGYSVSIPRTADKI